MATEGRTLRHDVVLDAPPQAVFDAWMDQEQHAAFTGCEAQIDWREGGRFTTCDERQFGYTLVLVPGRRIVQAWSHKAFPPHHYSVVTIELEPYGTGTRLQLTQTNVPPEALRWLDESWRTAYWEPLKRYLREAH
ncbi:MAG: SRPBCC domain-containing protein [Myxococcaceae bacterium]|nr:SRPBCC domain-containing protein [Myxococcaceae bacterium]